MNIIIHNNIKAIPEYTKVLFNKGAFFAILKKKYYNYNNNYTKYTWPFLNALVLLA